MLYTLETHMAISLDSISKTRRIRAPKIVIAGPGKIGKTTFAAMAPNAIGIITEEGQDAVDANAFPLATCLNDVYEAIGVLLNDEHDFKTVFLDSLDWLEPLVQAHVCAANGWKNIEAPGYGKGYTAAGDEWRNILAGFEALRSQKNMGIVLIAHDKIKRVDDPLTDGYDSHVIKLHDKAAALVQEWADVVGYCGYQVFTSQKDAGFGQKETKATTTGNRLLYVEPHPGHCGGNRFGLRNMDLNWNSFAAAMDAANQA